MLLIFFNHCEGLQTDGDGADLKNTTRTTRDKTKDISPTNYVNVNVESQTNGIHFKYFICICFVIQLFSFMLGPHAFIQKVFVHYAAEPVPVATSAGDAHAKISSFQNLKSLGKGKGKCSTANMNKEDATQAVFDDTSSEREGPHDSEYEFSDEDDIARIVRDRQKS